MSPVHQLLADLKAADPDGAEYRDMGQLAVEVPASLQIEYGAAAGERQAVAGRWEAGRVVELILWSPSGETWTLDTIESGDEADSYGVDDSGWPGEDEGEDE